MVFAPTAAAFDRMDPRLRASVLNGSYTLAGPGNVSTLLTLRGGNLTVTPISWQITVLSRVSIPFLCRSYPCYSG